MSFGEREKCGERKRETSKKAKARNERKNW